MPRGCSAAAVRQLNYMECFRFIRVFGNKLFNFNLLIDNETNQKINKCILKLGIELTSLYCKDSKNLSKRDVAVINCSYDIEPDTSTRFN